MMQKNISGQALLPIMSALPVKKHWINYKMKVGLLNEGDAADLIVVKDLKTFEVLQTYIDGRLVAENGTSKIESVKTGIINRFDCVPIRRDDLYIFIPAKEKQIQVIEA